MTDVTIIVPVYNAATYVERGLRSVLTQAAGKYSYEVVVVDDGSDDDGATTAALARVVADAPVPVRIVTLPRNIGPGPARNVGIDMAVGRYICFADIDDEVSPTLVASCAAVMDATGADVLIFGMRVINTHGRHWEFVERFTDQVATGHKAIAALIADGLTEGAVGNGGCANKCYRTEFVKRHKLHLPDMRRGEDQLFNLEVYQHARTVATISAVLYTWHINAASLSQAWRPRMFDNGLRLASRHREAFARIGVESAAARRIVDARVLAAALSALTAMWGDRGCQLDKAQRRAEFNRVTAHPAVRRAVGNAPRPRRLEQRLLNRAVERRNRRLMGATVRIYGFLRDLRLKMHI